MLRRAALLMAAGMVLAACAGAPEDAISCPDVEVLRDLGEVTRFRPGPGRDPTDMLLEAWVDSVGGSCMVDDAQLLVDLTVRIVTRRGPAAQSESATIPYFVAITDLQRKVLSRRTFETTASYVSRKSISFEDVLTLTIPLTADDQPESFVVYVGLELSEDELKHNRERTRNRRK